MKENSNLKFNKIWESIMIIDISNKITNSLKAKENLLFLDKINDFL